MAVETRTVAQVCAEARSASLLLARADGAARNAALVAMADALEVRTAEILEANQRDLEAGREAGFDAALLDRLALDEGRVAEIARDTRNIAAMDDPIGEIIEERTLENGLLLKRMRVPLGVIAVVYEARPNVTIDCSALCIKSGNAIVLRGSSAAEHSNAVLAAIASDAVIGAGLPQGTVSIIDGGQRSEMEELATQVGVVDLIVPRGGEGLKNALAAVAKVPVLYAGSGNCHVFVDETADVAMATEIVLNSKVQRPSTCNAAETLLVHSAIAAEFLPGALAALREAGVELRVDERSRAASGELADSLGSATEEDWATEYHALILAVKVVDSVDEAIDHINHFGSAHSEAIVTDSRESAAAFTEAVDAAAVYVNASTRFTDGAQFGLGAEIGNSTQKLHARGPIGLRELTTYKYVVEGTGQVRT
ncbi:MAG: glutamate-5-semialdehyde dehydrogenase [Thermoleophilaceae bacterium]|jgi:glutamate-5-semialdehyde dehydrogenase|nr:glutamate-5-semialdehyde dehydrogenase [Thermoleophilaceae bacterium]